VGGEPSGHASGVSAEGGAMRSDCVGDLRSVHVVPPNFVRGPFDHISIVAQGEDFVKCGVITAYLHAYTSHKTPQNGFKRKRIFPALLLEKYAPQFSL